MGGHAGAAHWAGVEPGPAHSTLLPAWPHDPPSLASRALRAAKGDGGPRQSVAGLPHLTPRSDPAPQAQRTSMSGSGRTEMRSCTRGRSTSRHPLPWPLGEPCPPPVPAGHGARMRAWGFSPAPPAGRPRPLTSLSLRGCGSDPRLSHRSPCPVLPFLPALGRLLSAGRPPPWTVARPLGISTRPSEALPAGLCQPATGHCRCGCRTLLGLLREGLWDTDLGGQGHAPGVNIGHSGLSC